MSSVITLDRLINVLGGGATPWRLRWATRFWAPCPASNAPAQDLAKQ